MRQSLSYTNPLGNHFLWEEKKKNNNQETWILNAFFVKADEWYLWFLNTLNYTKCTILVIIKLKRKNVNNALKKKKKKAKVFNKTSFWGANKHISEDGNITDEFNMVLTTGFQEALKNSRGHKAILHHSHNIACSWIWCYKTRVCLLRQILYDCKHSFIINPELGFMSRGVTLSRSWGVCSDETCLI